MAALVLLLACDPEGVGGRHQPPLSLASHMRMHTPRVTQVLERPAGMSAADRLEEWKTKTAEFKTQYAIRTKERRAKHDVHRA